MKFQFYSAYTINRVTSQPLHSVATPQVGDIVQVKYIINERKFFRKKVRVRPLKTYFSGLCIAHSGGSHRLTVILRKALQQNVIEAGFNLLSPAVLSVRWIRSTRKFGARKLFWLRGRPDRFSKVKNLSFKK
jgi:ribosomal protein L19